MATDTSAASSSSLAASGDATSSSDPTTATATATKTTTNPRGIPTFPFMTSVSEYVKTLDDVEPTLQRFQEMISKYTFMQQNVERRAEGLREKLPEMKRSLDTVLFLKRQREQALHGREGTRSEHDDDDDDDDTAASRTTRSRDGEIETTFSLSETLYAKARIAPATLDSVYLWLGANVMVAYPLDEAEALLRGKLAKATESLAAGDEDVEFLRVQITSLEVATARVYNYDVHEKRKLKLAHENEAAMSSIRDGVGLEAPG